MVGGEVAQVSLRSPPPLGRPMAATHHGARPRRASTTEPVVAEGEPTDLIIDVPAPVGRRGGRRRRRPGSTAWAASHPFPTCVVCGPDRERVTGFASFPGRCRAAPARTRRPGAPTQSSRTRTARAPRVRVGRARLPHQRPGSELRRGPAGGPRPPHARLGCPGSRQRAPLLLSWPLGMDGRKRHRACALFDDDGRMICASQALWIELEGHARAVDWAGQRDRTRRSTAPVPSVKPRVVSRSRWRGTRHGGARRPRRRVQPGLHLPEGHRPEGAARGPRPPDHAPGAPGWRARGGHLGRGIRGDRPPAHPHPRAARPQCRGHLRGKPQRAQPLLPHLRAGPAEGTRQRNIFSASTVDQMPKQVSCGLMFGHLLSVPVPDVDRCDHLLHPRRQPAGLERKPHDGAQHARPAARYPRARRQGRGGGSAPHPHRRGGRRTPLHPPRHRRPAAGRHGRHAHRGVAWWIPAPWPITWRGSRRCRSCS